MLEFLHPFGEASLAMRTEIRLHAGKALREIAQHGAVFEFGPIRKVQVGQIRLPFLIPLKIKINTMLSWH